MALYVFYVQPQRKGKLVGNGIHHQHRFLGIDCIFYLGGGGVFSQRPFSTGSLWFDVRNFNIGK